MYVNTVVRGHVTNVDTACEAYKTSTMDKIEEKQNKSKCGEYIKTFKTP